MIIQALTSIGTRQALLFNTELLVAAGLTPDTLFQITMTPGGGLSIQSVPTLPNVVHTSELVSEITE